MQNLLNSQSGREVSFVTPQSFNNGTLYVSPFIEVNVKTLIDDAIKCGIYLIGTVMPRMNQKANRIYHEFRVCYFGRSDDDNYSLQDRICDHLAEGGREGEDFRYNERLFFSACGCDDSREAYDEEVKLFKIFFSDTGSRIVGNGYQDDIHSSRNIKNTNPCLPLLPCNVFVDNINRPAQPRE